MVMIMVGPGEYAPVAGKWVLRGAYGKPTGLDPVECAKGVRLPIIGVADDLGPVYWVLVERYSTEAALAA